MKVGIHIHYKGKIGPFSEKYIKILEHNRIPFEILDINQIDFWERLKSCTHFIFHWGGYSDHYQIAHTILPIIENDLDIKCFPNLRTYWHHDDKIRQFYLLKTQGHPVVDSWIFWDKKKAFEWIRNAAQFPLVFKLSSSAGSKDVVLVKTKYQAFRILRAIFGKGIFRGHVPGNWKIKFIDFKLKDTLRDIAKYFYRLFQERDTNYLWKFEKNHALFQKYLPNNAFDTRVTVIGNAIFAFRRFNRDGDFRSSGSGKIDYNIAHIDHKLLAAALQISNDMNFQSMAYDFLWDNDIPAVCEMSYTYNDKAVFRCPGFFDDHLCYHEGHFWPQYLQLKDLLELKLLIQPVFDE